MPRRGDVHGVRLLSASLRVPFDPGLLPPLVVAWREDAAAHSGGVHRDLRERYGAGESAVRSSMAELGELARAARGALVSGDGAALANCADASFAARARMMDLDTRHVEMVKSAAPPVPESITPARGGAVVCGARLPVTRSKSSEPCVRRAAALSSLIYRSWRPRPSFRRDVRAAEDGRSTAVKMVRPWGGRSFSRPLLEGRRLLATLFGALTACGRATGDIYCRPGPS